MFLMGINCAMTPIDFERLKKENINFAEGTVSFRRGKTGKVLAVSSLWSRTRKLLEKHLSERKGDSEYIFASCQGSPIRSRSISSLFNKLREKLKIDDSVKFNHLRDTFSTISQDLGFPLERINLVMGHKNKGMQDHYAVRNCNKLTQEMCKAVEQEFFKMK